MPIEDVRRKIERLERKVADLQMLERLYDERQGGGDGDPEATPEETGFEQAPAADDAGPSELGGEAHEPGEG
jgi:hypothetical protein